MSVPNLIWAYPWDLLDEGIGAALDRMQGRAAATDVAVAAVYHAGRFLHPNNPRRKVVFPESGTLYYPPSDEWYGTLPIRPPVWPEAADGRFWPTLREQADDRGLGLTAWTLALHNSGIGTSHPACSVLNAYGDRLRTDLCPANPEVGHYVAAVTRDIAGSLPVDRIMIESLEFMPFQHGFHHEVIGVPVGPTIGLLLTLCFCQHCLHAAADHGVDGERVRGWVRVRVEEHFADPFGAGPQQLTWPQLRDCADGQLGGYLDMRARVVGELTRRVAAGIREASDCAIAIADFGPLYPHGPDGRRWESGLDLDLLDGVVDEVHPTFYFTDPDVHSHQVETYLALVAGTGLEVHPAIRAILPQTASAERLEEQLRPLTGRADGVSFYNYGFMARQTLDWIGSAIEGFTVRDRLGEESA